MKKVISWNLNFIRFIQNLFKPVMWNYLYLAEWLLSLKTLFSEPLLPQTDDSLGLLLWGKLFFIYYTVLSKLKHY